MKFYERQEVNSVSRCPDNKPEYIELYQAAWLLAAEHIKDIPDLPSVRHMDEGFNPSVMDMRHLLKICAEGFSNSLSS